MNNIYRINYGIRNDNNNKDLGSPSCLKDKQTNAMIEANLMITFFDAENFHQRY